FAVPCRPAMNENDRAFGIGRLVPPAMNIEPVDRFPVEIFSGCQIGLLERRALPNLRYAHECSRVRSADGKAHQVVRLSRFVVETDPIFVRHRCQWYQITGYSRDSDFFAGWQVDERAAPAGFFDFDDYRLIAAFRNMSLFEVARRVVY